jgi:hypothetical protein
MKPQHPNRHAGRHRRADHLPTLVLEAENDATFRGEAQRVAQALTCRTSTSC